MTKRLKKRVLPGTANTGATPVRVSERQLANLRPWKPGQSGNPSGKPKGINEAVRLAREAAPEAMRRLIELMKDPDSRVASIAALGVYEKATGKHFDPSSVREDTRVGINFDKLTLEELKFLKRIVEKGAITLPADQAQKVAADEVVIEGEADTISAPDEDNSET